MIQLSTLSTATPENPAKSAGLAVLDGAFAMLLDSEGEGGKAAGGKSLPEGGKILPDGLPDSAAKGLLAVLAPFGGKAAQAEVEAPPALEAEMLAGEAGPVPEQAPEPKRNRLEGEAPPVAKHPLPHRIAKVAVDDAPKAGETAVPLSEPKLAAAAEPDAESDVQPVESDVAETEDAPLPAPAPSDRDFPVKLPIEAPPAFAPVALVLPAQHADAPEETAPAVQPRPRAALQGALRAAPHSEAPAPVAQDDAPAAEPTRQPAMRLSSDFLGSLLRRDRPVAPSAAPAMRETSAESAPAQEPARIAPALRPMPFREIRLELARGADGADTARPGAVRAPRATAALSATPAPQGEALPQAVQLAEQSASAPETRPAAFSAARADAVRPHDLTMLVDRLVEARQSARADSASISLMHSDFGEVSVRFGHDKGNLTVSLANSDPGFVRAVSAAVAEAPAPGDAAMQGDRRGESGHNHAARAQADAQFASDRGGQGRERDRGEPADRPELRRDAAERPARKGRSGIFA